MKSRKTKEIFCSQEDGRKRRGSKDEKKNIQSFSDSGPRIPVPQLHIYAPRSLTFPNAHFQPILCGNLFNCEWFSGLGARSTLELRSRIVLGLGVCPVIAGITYQTLISRRERRSDAPLRLGHHGACRDMIWGIAVHISWFALGLKFE